MRFLHANNDSLSRGWSLLSFDGDVCSKKSVDIDYDYDNVDDDTQLCNAPDVLFLHNKFCNVVEFTQHCKRNNVA